MGYGIGTSTTRPVRPVRPINPAAARPDNRGGPFGASPAFPSLASPGHTKAPPPPKYTNDQVTQSLAHNPQAAGSNGSLFAYQGQPAAAVSPAINPAPVAPVAPNVSYDYNADPILAQTKALSGKNRGDAQAGALAAKKQLAIDYNDTALANQLGDAGTAAAAAQNPFGVLEQLKRSYGQGAQNLDENLNNQNLFYGGRRIQEQGNLLHDYQGQQAGAAGQEQGLLGGIGDQLAAALSAADAADIKAQQDAADRAAAAADAAGVDPGAGAGALTAGATGNVDPNPPGTPIGAVDPITAALSSNSFSPSPQNVLDATVGAAPFTSGFQQSVQDAVPSAPAGPGPQDILSALSSAAPFTSGFQQSVQGAPVMDPLAAALSTQNKKRLLQFG